MTTDTRRIEDAIHQLSDDALVPLLARELRARASMRPVSDQVTALLAMGPGLSRVRVELLQDVSASAARTRILTDAATSILSHPMLDSAGVSRVLGKSPSSRNPASRVAATGTVVSLPVGARRLFPAFQFDAATHRVLPIVAELNKLLDAKGDPWGVASWWLSPTDFGDDPRSPAELAVTGGASDELRIIAADLLAD